MLLIFFLLFFHISQCAWNIYIRRGGNYRSGKAQLETFETSCSIKKLAKCWQKNNRNSTENFFCDLTKKRLVFCYLELMISIQFSRNFLETDKNTRDVHGISEMKFNEIGNKNIIKLPYQTCTGQKFIRVHEHFMNLISDWVNEEIHHPTIRQRINNLNFFLAHIS